VIDLNDSMGNSFAGLHFGGLGGLWQAAVFGFGGMSLREDGLSFDPHLPSRWSQLRFAVRWRRRHLAVVMSQEACLLEITLKQGRPMTIHAAGRPYRLEQGLPLSIPLQPKKEDGT
jgi:trehalose/maltose hydrolase-like predicted phosphorylase